MTARPALALPHALPSGRVVDLAAPCLDGLDWRADVARPLARIARWSGGTSGGIWSVAQHSIVGADALLDETGDPRTALAFLLHDAAEIVFGNIQCKARAALDLHVALGLRLALGPVVAEAALRDIGGGLFLGALSGFDAALTGEFHRLVGLPKALPPAMRRAVDEMDLRMADAEDRMLCPALADGHRRRDIHGAMVDAAPIRRRGPLTPWPEKKVIAAYLSRLAQWRIRAD
jgi:hypothetical protein